MFDNAVLTRFASAQPNLFRDLQALSWSHGFHARSVASLPRLPHPASPPTANPGAARRPPERRSHDPVWHGLAHRHWTKDARRHPQRDPRPRDRRARVEARRGPSPRNRRARTGNPGGPRPGNRLRLLRALHGWTFERLREHGALWNRSGRRTRRRYPRTRTGALDLSPLITHEFPLTQVEAALEAVRSRAGLKVAVRPGRDKPTER